MDDATETLPSFSYYIYFKILPQQNFKQVFSKITHSRKCQNDVLQDNIFVWMPSLQVYIAIGTYIIRPNWVSMQHG